jgi:hypothetical protein
VRRWNSWYDERLVTQKGEDILAGHDNWAIAELRSRKLVWSGWGPMQKLGDIQGVPGTPWGVRTIDGIDPTRLRLFCLSLLWRAAATGRNEFREVSIPQVDLERLRELVCDGDVGPADFYPAHICQISTLGEFNNLTPTADVKSMPSTEEGRGWSIPIFRFHIGRNDDSLSPPRERRWIFE